jgi:hypothetical protein
LVLASLLHSTLTDAELPELEDCNRMNEGLPMNVQCDAGVTLEAVAELLASSREARVGRAGREGIERLGGGRTSCNNRMNGVTSKLAGERTAG